MMKFSFVNNFVSNSCEYYFYFISYLCNLIKQILINLRDLILYQDRRFYQKIVKKCDLSLKMLTYIKLVLTDQVSNFFLTLL